MWTLGTRVRRFTWLHKLSRPCSPISRGERSSSPAEDPGTINLSAHATFAVHRFGVLLPTYFVVICKESNLPQNFCFK